MVLLATGVLRLAGEEGHLLVEPVDLVLDPDGDQVDCQLRSATTMQPKLSGAQGAPA